MSEKDAAHDIAEARTVIDRCDETIIAAIAERLRAARRIGAGKKTLGRGVRDEGRENALRDRRDELCDRFGAPRDLVEKVFDVIVGRSREIQKRLDEPNEGR